RSLVINTPVAATPVLRINFFLFIYILWINVIKFAEINTFPAACKITSCKQARLILGYAVRRSIKRTLFDNIMGILGNTKRMVDRLMDLVDHDRVLHGLAGSFIGRTSVYRPFFNTSAKQ